MLLAAALIAATALPPDPGLLLQGATVYSAKGRARLESILIRDGKIVFVGDPDEARLQAGDARTVDLTGAFVFPGWADSHGHLASLGHALETADLRGSPRPADSARRMATLAARVPAPRWVEGRGWDQNRWPDKTFPDARDLDAVLPDRPALASRVDGHAVWINSAALQAAGIRAATPDPPGGRILRRPDGSPSGVLLDNAMSLAERAMPKTSPADFERQILSAALACARVGLTEVQDASAYSPENIAALKRLADARKLPIRVYATVASDPKLLPHFLAQGIHVGGGANFLTVRAIKTWADGALGSRGAALLEDYSDDPGNKGLLVTPPRRLDELARQARAKGWQLWIHAIGDRANRLALDAFAKAEKSVPHAASGGDRPRIEHAQIVDSADFARFKEEGVIASIQPTHATSDMAWAKDRLGGERLQGAYAWRKLVRAGARLTGGSDFPVESENPLLGFYAAVTRQDLSGSPPGGWRPRQRLNQLEALALFTSDAAYAAFEEDRRGNIAPGFEADLTVLGKDPMTTLDFRQIPSIPVLLTVVGGRIAYDGLGVSAGSNP